MRIIAGLAKGCALSGPGREKIRPTPDKVRQALFNIIDVEGAVFLDLFSGTGAVGCEAISRGATEVVMVDASRKAARIIKNNVEKTTRVAKSKANARIITRDAEDFLRGADGPYDVIFCDPPYEWDGKNRLVELVFERGLLRYGGSLVLECAHRDVGEVSREPRDIRRYGDTALLIFG
ncbi:MAG: 16S rRNA (guanine(966)-N(2))-methyltransferase RsmD [Nitrospinae bacterium]|nr:16S rRNA (guanine(966)-N(2))-methyltransferase RsmD [Nitrospinota bacterium]